MTIRKIVALLLSALLLCACFSACSIPDRKPQEGLYYCEELMIEIDFALANGSEHSSKLYDEDGNCQDILCHFDYGRGLSFAYDEAWESNFFFGTFRYRGGVFYVTENSTGNVYAFQRIEQ